MTSCRLIFRNVRKNIRDYLIYFITLLLSVSLFYAFNAALSPTIFVTLATGLQNMTDSLRSLVSLCSYVISGMLAFLIVYANQFLLKRRKKELGLYMLLGMSKRRISTIFVGETLLIGVLSLVLGLLAGLPLSQGLSMMSLQLFGGDIHDFQLVLSVPSLMNTIGCFIAIYVIVMIANVANLSKMKLINLLQASRKNQNVRTKNRLFFLGCFIGALLLFLLAALAFSQWKDFYPSKTTSLCILVGVAGGTFLCFYSLFAVVLDVAKSLKGLYLKNLNTFLFRQMESRVHTNFFSMSIVCLLLFVTIVFTSSGFSVSSAIDTLMKRSLICDVAIMTDFDALGESSVLELAKTHGQDLEPYLEDSVQIASYLYDDDITYDSLFEGQEVELWTHHAQLPELPVRFIGISDYNACLEFTGKEPVVLGESQFLINSVMDDTVDELKGFLKDRGEIVVAGRELKAQQTDLLDNVWFLSGVGNNDFGTIIVPDPVARNLNNVGYHLLGNFRSDVDPAEMEALVYSLTNSNGDPLADSLDEGFHAVTKYLQKAMYISANGLPVYLSLYLGVVFLIICVTLIALQQLTEMADNVKRYRLLERLGANKSMLNRTLLKQVGIYFAAPLLLASLFVSVGMSKIVMVLSDFLNMEIGMSATATVLIFLLVYGGYYLATYLSCKRMLLEPTR